MPQESRQVGHPEIPGVRIIDAGQPAQNSLIYRVFGAKLERKSAQFFLVPCGIVTAHSLKVSQNGRGYGQPGYARHYLVSRGIDNAIEYKRRVGQVANRLTCCRLD